MGDLHSAAFSPLPCTPTHDSCSKAERCSVMGNILHVSVCKFGSYLGCPATTSVLSSSSSLYRCDIMLHFPLRISGTPALHLCIAALASPSFLMCLRLSLFLSPTRSPSPFLIPLLYLFLSLPPSLSPLMNHLPLPLNSTESEGSSKVASISPTSHSRETRKQQTALPAVHQRTHTRTHACVFLPDTGEYERSQISLGPVCDLHVVCKWMRHYMTIPFLSMHRYTEEKVHVRVHMCRICAFST